MLAALPLWRALLSTQSMNLDWKLAGSTYQHLPHLQFKYWKKKKSICSLSSRKAETAELPVPLPVSIDCSHSLQLNLKKNVEEGYDEKQENSPIRNITSCSTTTDYAETPPPFWSYYHQPLYTINCRSISSYMLKLIWIHSRNFDILTELNLSSHRSVHHLM